MRLKIIALASLLTIAVPVEAGPEPPEDVTDIGGWLRFVNEQSQEIGGCVGFTNVPVGVDNLESMRLMAAYLTNPTAKHGEIFYLKFDAYVYGYDGMFFEFDRSGSGLNFC